MISTQNELVSPKGLLVRLPLSDYLSTDWEIYENNIVFLKDVPIGRYFKLMGIGTMKYKRVQPVFDAIQIFAVSEDNKLCQLSNDTCQVKLME